ncbi:hypothetical protein [Streptomyces mirabilis]
MAKTRLRRVIAHRNVSRPEQIFYGIACCPAATALNELIRLRADGGH